MFRALVSVETKTELLDAAQALKLLGVDQSHHQLAFIGVSLQTDDVVNWIAIDAFRHCANINRTERASGGANKVLSGCGGTIVTVRLDALQPVVRVLVLW